MALDRVLSQEEIDVVFRTNARWRRGRRHCKTNPPYDFAVRIVLAKDHLGDPPAHDENFAHSLASSLSPTCAPT